jgi:hypothetical protein
LHVKREFQIFTKVIANRLSLVASKLIRHSQTTFLPGRYILEGVVILHETIHKLQRKKHSGIILKIDFEKAYDKVNWPFLQQVLRMKGFSERWCAWIDKVVTRGSVCVKVNDDTRHFFQTKQGLRQGGPLSSWKGKVLSAGERLVLINSVLSRLPMYMLSFF